MSGWWAREKNVERENFFWKTYSLFCRPFKVNKTINEERKTNRIIPKFVIIDDPHYQLYIAIICVVFAYLRRIVSGCEPMNLVTQKIQRYANDALLGKLKIIWGESLLQKKLSHIIISIPPMKINKELYQILKSIFSHTLGKLSLSPIHPHIKSSTMLALASINFNVSIQLPFLQKPSWSDSSCLENHTKGCLSVENYHWWEFSFSSQNGPHLRVVSLTFSENFFVSKIFQWTFIFYICRKVQKNGLSFCSYYWEATFCGRFNDVEFRGWPYGPSGRCFDSHSLECCYPTSHSTIQWEYQPGR